ncbi:MAG: secretin N-terminal domain-containing protein [Thermoanaerobaculia bacterium]
MKKTFSLVAATAFLAAALPLIAADEAAVKVFMLKYKRVEEALLLIRPLLSLSASVTLTPSLNAMTVTDREENLRTVAKVLAGFDLPPRGFTIAVKLVRARADVPAGSMSAEIGGLGAKLKALFQFNDYALIDSAVLRGVEGEPISYRLGDDYQISFTIGRSSFGEVLLLSPFTLSRMKKNEQGRVVPVPLYSNAMPIELNQTLVVGASREEASKSALILIILMQEIPAPGASDKGPGGTKTVERKDKQDKQP